MHHWMENTWAVKSGELKMKTCRVGKKYHIDTDFENERLVDNVTILECPGKNQKKVLVHSPALRADILVSKKDLMER